MTINVAVVTSEAIVLGCDSVASSNQPLLDPFVHLVNGDGVPVVDDDGRWTVKFRPSEIARVTTHARSGVTKMFRLCNDGNPVAATTAGLAALNGKNIAECVDDYRQECGTRDHDTVLDVVREFSGFMRQRYEQHYNGDLTPVEYQDDVEFLVGGYGARDPFPSLYRINLHRTDEQYKIIYGPDAAMGTNGVAWAGQSDAVERVIFGYDYWVRRGIEDQVERYLKQANEQMSHTVAAILERALDAAGCELPAGIDTNVPMPSPLSLDWHHGVLDMDVGNLPLQDAVDLASFLVNLQSGKSLFVRGVPTVGGRTHVGVIQRHGFKQLNEPTLQHRNVGYDRSL